MRNFIAATFAATVIGSLAATPTLAQGELTTIEVGAIPVTDAATLLLGEEQGFFSERGIELNLNFAQGGAAVVPGVVSGQFQLGYSNTISIFQAVERGLPLVMLNVSSASHADPELGINDLMVRGDDSVQSVTDLEGQRVAVNTLGNFAEILARHAIDEGGGDSSAVSFVELAFPDQLPALERGDIAAYLAGEPFRTLGLQQGFRTLSNTHQALTPDASFISGAWFTTRAAVESDPDLFARLQEAIREANAYAAANSDEMRPLIPAFTGLDPALADEINLSNYEPDLTAEDLRPLADAAVRYGVLQAEPDYDAVIWRP